VAGDGEERGWQLWRHLDVRSKTGRGIADWGTYQSKLTITSFSAQQVKVDRVDNGSGNHHTYEGTRSGSTIEGTVNLFDGKMKGTWKAELQ
jgi:hypothetical protein